MYVVLDYFIISDPSFVSRVVNALLADVPYTINVAWESILLSLCFLPKIVMISTFLRLTSYLTYSISRLTIYLVEEIGECEFYTLFPPALFMSSSMQTEFIQQKHGTPLYGKISTPSQHLYNIILDSDSFAC